MSSRQPKGALFSSHPESHPPPSTGGGRGEGELKKVIRLSPLTLTFSCQGRGEKQGFRMETIYNLWPECLTRTISRVNETANSISVSCSGYYKQFEFTQELSG